MSFNVTTHTEYECSGCKFTALPNEILVVADYWEDANNEANKKFLNGWGSNTYSEFSQLAQKTIFEDVRAKYGKDTAATGVALLNMPKLVMKFKLLTNGN